MEQLSDSDVAGWWQRLGLAGSSQHPSPYIRQLEAPERLREPEPALDDEWLRAVCWFNGQRLIGP